MPFRVQYRVDFVTQVDFPQQAVRAALLGARVPILRFLKEVNSVSGASLRQG